VVKTKRKKEFKINIKAFLLTEWSVSNEEKEKEYATICQKKYMQISIIVFFFL
jgi:hypothetical protein